jgi:hypothetical protein
MATAKIGGIVLLTADHKEIINHRRGPVLRPIDEEVNDVVDPRH